MYDGNIKHVEKLCHEVRLLCGAVLTEREEDPVRSVVGTATSGTLRRRSMDLTRALAEMRKS